MLSYTGKSMTDLLLHKTPNSVSSEPCAGHKMNRASRQTKCGGKKILKIAPNTVAGLLVMIRVVETHDQIVDGEPAEQLLTKSGTSRSASA
jgi:hypothetical protein